MGNNVYTFGTTEPPQISLDGREQYTLPYPNGQSRDDLKIYDFDEQLLDSFRTEGNRQIDIGKKFIFVANLKWIAADKTLLNKFFKAQKEGSFLYYLNKDVDLKYRVKVASLKFRTFAGLGDSVGGYSIQLQLRGMEYVDKPDLGALIFPGSETGYGLNYGKSYGENL